MRNLLLGIGCIGLFAQPLSAQSGGDSNAATNWQAVESCAQLSSPASRHSCLDKVLRDAGLLSFERERAEQQDSFGQQVALKPQNKEKAAEVTPSPSGPPPEVVSVEATVAFARLVRRKLLLIVTDGGAVWRQTSNEHNRRPPKVGSSFQVSQTTLGGYRCRIGRSTVYRCERLD